MDERLVAFTSRLTKATSANCARCEEKRKDQRLICALMLGDECGALQSPLPTGEALYVEALRLVVEKFSVGMPNGYLVENRIAKMGMASERGLLQVLHWPAEDSAGMAERGFSWYPQEWHSLSLVSLGKWLVDHAGDVASKFLEEIRRKRIFTFYALELPLGTLGALYQAPFRLIWTYDIKYDCFMARFDVLGN